MRPTYKVVWFPGAPADLANLKTADPHLAAAALAAIDDLAHHRKRGKALGRRNISGDLSGCYRLKFDLPGRDRNQRFRLVYRLRPVANPTIVEIVILGIRADHEVYQDAVNRLANP